MRRAVTLALSVALFVLPLAGCSPSKSPTASDQSSQEPSASEGDGLGSAEIRRAEQAAKDELPDAPIWEGVKFAGVVLDDSTVCVDRTWRNDGGIDGKGGSAGYVLVTFPDETLGEPQDGLCADVSSAPETKAAPPVEVPDEVQGDPGLVTRDDLGEEWPLTVDFALLACEPKTAGGMELQIASLAAPDETVYALNGTAKDHTDYADIDPIWADDPDVEGLKINIGPLIDRARALC